MATDRYTEKFRVRNGLLTVHNRESCEGRHCVIHDPSPHHMVEWSLLWRGDIGVMERTCPHGIGHPDPDDVAYNTSVGRDWVAVHGCDGCCSQDPIGAIQKASAGLYDHADEDPNCGCTASDHEPDCPLQ